MCVVGGGITGAGIARDLALRGVDVVLLEKGDLGVGSTGRSHGLVHSGGRYVVTDPESAAQCASENLILRRIAPSFLQDTGGLFVGFRGDDEGYYSEFARGCRSAGVVAEELTPEEALRLEPGLSQDVEVAFRVMDAVADPFLLTVANAYAASLEGAEVLTYAEVVGIRDGVVRYRRDGEHEVKAEVVVNASGVWAAKVAELAGYAIPLKAYRGTILVYAGRASEHVINRLRMPSQGDIMLPHRNTTLAGTTFSPESRLERYGIEVEEVRILRREAERVLPRLRSRRVLRAYAGLRPIVGEGKKRGFSLFPEEGFITITGGKFTTYRLMAEHASDEVCRQLGIRARCTTASTPILEEEQREGLEVYLERYGALGAEAAGYADRRRRICLCEDVSEGEVLFAAERLFCRNIRDIRRRTRLGMGYCQGRRCTFEAALVLYSAGIINHATVHTQVLNSLRERWKGLLPLAPEAEEVLRELRLMEATFGCAACYDRIKKHIRGLERFL